MKLYFSPLACSLATRIALYEAGAEATFVEVDGKTKKTADGIDFRTINPLGLVPTLEMEPGVVLTENAAILQLVAERFPDARLLPDDPLGRSRARQWLSFVGTELHKAVYLPLLEKTAPPEAKSHALTKAESRLRVVAERLSDREFLLDRFSVADAYLFAVLNWSQVTPVDLKPWTSIIDYQARLHLRPGVARAFAEERELYMRELARHGERAASPPRASGVAELMAKFNDAFLRHDPSLLSDLIAEDCVLENTHSGPDGGRYVGRDECLSRWQSIASDRSNRFELEATDCFADRAIIRWRYFPGTAAGSSVRGVNLMRVRDGKIVEGLGYVKGA